MVKSIERVNFRLYPTKDQEKIMILNCHNARFAYNWATAKVRSAIEAGEPIPSKYTLASEFVKFKKTPGYEWLSKKPASQRATKLAITNSLSMALKKFYKRQSGAPAFHSKRNARMSYYTHEGTTKYEHDQVRLENLGWVKCKNHLPIDNKNVKICDPIVIYTGDYFMLSCSLKYKTPVKPRYHYTDVDIHHTAIGIDVGVTHMAVTSDGDFYDIPHEKLAKLDKRIARIDRRIDRIRKMGNVTQTYDTKTKYSEVHSKSQNLLKLESKRRKLYARHANIRKDIRCKAVADIIKKYPSAIVMEDIINPKKSWGVKGAHSLNKKISDVAVGDFIQRIKHKCQWHDIPLIIAPKSFPSTKTCSHCGNVLDNQLTEDRMFICSNCGHSEDRDINAAKNLRDLAYHYSDIDYELDLVV